MVNCNCWPSSILRSWPTLKNILPCEKCRNHYDQTLTTYPIENHLENKESLFKWLVDVHNRVNIDNGKREYSYDEVTKLYENIYSLIRFKDFTQMLLYKLWIANMYASIT